MPTRTQKPADQSDQTDKHYEDKAAAEKAAGVDTFDPEENAVDFFGNGAFVVHQKGSAKAAQAHPHGRTSHR